MLSIAGLAAGYGRKQILSGIDLEVRAGEIVVVLGANGAGKTTLLNAVSGMCRINAGRITFKGTDITAMRPDRIAAAGLSHCPEGRQIFQRLTVEENLVVAHVGRGGKSFETLREEAFALFPILRERRNSAASRLSGGQQQMLAIGRALMAEPDLVMLDEPSLGLAPKLITQIFQIVLDLAAAGISILLVEQNVRLALELGDYGYALESGRLRVEGGAQKLAADPRLAEVYLAGGDKGAVHA
ncbi:ABC transporter ATP-binding protein [Methylobrevis pamukkalensis]|uniref:High-affinity branched-chain amino acid transport ATP-binding protein LivF n=1 Tax=Methylobrevis pamukkalensis TaxID=1439726 RepID=A0A1E3H4K2_9HYPH|nr:ABC transporter ATP-binding protein [Methylobrevis pamukkalensis]ODN71242.1 High-affinity branched-chain amino acid transport ATP-binding protein LivF [Methylobrevis pamukkalensis]